MRSLKQVTIVAIVLGLFCSMASAYSLMEKSPVAATYDDTQPGLLSVQMIHESTERYYENGTQVITTPGLGGSNFTVGEIEGSPIWEVIEKGWWDEAEDYTILSYTVGNDSFSDPITSFHAPKPIDPLHATAPTGWTVQILADEIVWSTTDESMGIPLFETLDTMIVVYPGLLDITYEPGAKVDFADGTLLSNDNDNWVVSTVLPEPCSMLGVLVGLGWVGFKRRH